LIKVSQFSFNPIYKAINEDNIKITSINVFNQEVSIYMSQEDINKLNNPLIHQQTILRFENNLTMVVYRAQFSPKEKVNILNQTNILVEKYNIIPMEIIDKKNELIQIFKNLSKKQDSILREKITPPKNKSPAL
jgi:hypothetical protein